MHPAARDGTVWNLQPSYVPPPPPRSAAQPQPMSPPSTPGAGRNPHSYGQENYAGALAPTDGPYSRAIRAALGFFFVDPNGSTLPYRHKFGGWVGKSVFLGLADKAVVPSRAYGGDAPAGIQPTLTRLDPWTTPVR